MSRQLRYFTFLLSLTILACLALGFDVSPYFRGPAPYPPEWRWPYLFINTLPKIYLPLLSLSILSGFFVWEEKTEIFTKKYPKLFLFLLILLSFFFQISLLFFSRSGINVLIHRIIDPTLNGYFTASLTIKTLPDFLTHYNQTMLHYIYHAKAHPPGAILLFYSIKHLILPFPPLIQFINHFTPAHSDVKQTWDTLLPIDKATAVVAAFLIPFLSTLSLIPLYATAKLLYGSQAAMRSVFLFFLIPTIVFFIPINDAFLHIFSITAFFFFVKGLKQTDYFSLFLSGALLFLGTFFNVSLLPLLILFFIFGLFFLQKKDHVLLREYFKSGLAFTIGFLLPIFLLNLFFHFNFIQVIRTIMKYVPDVHTRSYTIWIYYNLYDFLIFSGIPIALVFLSELKQSIVDLLKKQFKKLESVFIALLIMILILDFSGSVRGETGRLWSAYIPFMVLIATNYLTNNLRFSSRLFLGFLLLQALQILVMQEFWVMLW